MCRLLWVIDLAAVLLFVGIGRSVHGHGLTVGGVTSTAWPFLVGLTVGWLAAWIWRCSLTSIASGLIVLALTVAIGMTLRVVSGQGIALAFVFVALGFLGAGLLGWRLLATGLRRRLAGGVSVDHVD
jgi:hypothetical protein